MAARARVIDFREGSAGTVGGKRTPKHKVKMGTDKQSQKQMRARIRRRGAISQEEFDTLYKPLEEWDLEELARGRPRNRAGDFRGAAPKWITREMHEACMGRFKDIVKGEMNRHTVAALDVVRNVLDNDLVDGRGRPLVAASTRLEAAKFLIEHIVGKPQQHKNVDVSVKLQALLATAIGSPVDGMGRDFLAQSPGEMPQLSQFAEAFGVIEVDSEEDDDDD
jgi:hypothetical protein